MTDRWRVCKRRNRWMVYGPDCDIPHEDWPTLHEAHTAAIQLAYATELFKPGGVTWLTAVLHLARGDRS